MSFPKCLSEFFLKNYKNFKFSVFVEDHEISLQVISIMLSRPLIIKRGVLMGKISLSLFNENEFCSGSQDY